MPLLGLFQRSDSKELKAHAVRTFEELERRANEKMKKKKEK